MLQRNEMSFMAGQAGEVRITCDGRQLSLVYAGPSEHAVYVALGRNAIGGSSIVPYSQGLEGSTVFLPFNADRIYCVIGGERRRRTWQPFVWTSLSTECPELHLQQQPAVTLLQVSLPAEYEGSILKLAVWVKELDSNSGWGSLVGCCDASVPLGPQDKFISSYFEFDPASIAFERRNRFHSSSRERIYELFVRLFGNTNARRKRNGTILENGCGKMADVSDAAIARIAEMGFTHIWLMGVIRHATATGYDLPGLAADETDLMKGLAGSPYAIRDFFDIAPDLANNPAERLEEFRALVERIHAAGLGVILDFVGNHVSRAYESIIRPEQMFGLLDDRSRFFAANNNFFYLSSSESGPPIVMPTFDRVRGQAISPTCRVKGDCDGLFAGETTFGRVTGNNCIMWTPSINDWYETVKLNYGFDFASGSAQARSFPHADVPDRAIPATWWKMNAVLEHWQELGVDGFRCDMAHMLPPEFWAWSIGLARIRDPSVFFMAEAYNDSFAVETRAPEVLALGGRTLFPGLLHAGFNAVYGHDAYRTIKGIYDGANWANDIDSQTGSEFVSSNSVHYAENHDEVRLASRYAWAAAGMRVGVPVSAVLLGLGRGPALFYSGQEVGEPAIEAEGFSGSDGRTSLFDYWSMPEFSKWVNAGRFDGALLSEEQQQLRAFYGRLVALCGEDAFRNGQFTGLNSANIQNPEYGRLDGEAASGHWFYAFVRYDHASGQRVLVVVNFHESQTMRNLRINLPESTLSFLALGGESTIKLDDRLNAGTPPIESPARSITLTAMPPLSARYLFIEAI